MSNTIANGSEAVADAQEQIRQVIQQPLPETEEPAPPESVQVVIKRAHPSNYPSHVDVRPALGRVLSVNSVDSGNSNSN